MPFSESFVEQTWQGQGVVANVQGQHMGILAGVIRHC